VFAASFSGDVSVDALKVAVVQKSLDAGEHVCGTVHCKEVDSLISVAYTSIDAMAVAGVLQLLEYGRIGFNANAFPAKFFKEQAVGKFGAVIRSYVEEHAIAEFAQELVSHDILSVLAVATTADVRLTALSFEPPR
jgi:hypothetical protein